MRRFDKGGENFYDQISAMHKSVRGSDPDAALYWMCRMLDGGCDPNTFTASRSHGGRGHFSFADPRAIEIARNAADIYDRLGSLKESWHLPTPWCILRLLPKAMLFIRRSITFVRLSRKDGSRPVPNVPKKRANKAHEGSRVSRWLSLCPR